MKLKVAIHSMINREVSVGPKKYKDSMLLIENVIVEVEDADLQQWAKDRGQKVSELAGPELREFLLLGDPEKDVYSHSYVQDDTVATRNITTVKFEHDPIDLDLPE